MVPAGDEKVLANCIQLVLTGDFRIGDLGKNGYKMVQKSYTWDIVVQNTYDEYKKLIKR
jgi:glycosyltransferase involved in cell wall biosynthesis